MILADAIQTFGGRRIRPLDTDPAQIDVADVAHALSHLCRFGGHCRVFYSVAQHSVLAADAVVREGGDADDALWALLHDAPEAYLGDLPHPLKHSPYGEAYREAEARLQEAVCLRFGLPLDPPPLLKRIDRALLAAERAALMAPAWDWPELDGVEALDVEVVPQQPAAARAAFLDRYERLERAR